MIKENVQIYSTKEYHLFNSIDGNRTVNKKHVNRLKKSMSENYLFTLIIVNEKYEIIDGQHRFQAIKELGLPLYFIVKDGYQLDFVHQYNINTQNWKSADYLESYCGLGNLQYLEFKKFITKHEINMQIAMYILTGDDSGNMVKMFNAGLFKIKDIKEAEDIMDKLNKCAPYFARYKTRWFVYAIIRLLKKPQFEFEDFLNKLKTQPTALQVCNDVKQYVELIEEIYNYRRREKVNLRY